MEEFCHEKIIKLVVEMIETNIHIYYNNRPEDFKEIRKYCEENEENSCIEVSQNQLQDFTKEILYGLMTCDYLYDFRPLE